MSHPFPKSIGDASVGSIARGRGVWPSLGRGTRYPVSVTREVIPSVLILRIGVTPPARWERIALICLVRERCPVSA